MLLHSHRHALQPLADAAAQLRYAAQLLDQLRVHGPGLLVLLPAHFGAGAPLLPAVAQNRLVSFDAQVAAFAVLDVCLPVLSIPLLDGFVPQLADFGSLWLSLVSGLGLPERGIVLL